MIADVHAAIDQLAGSVVSLNSARRVAVIRDHIAEQDAEIARLCAGRDALQARIDGSPRGIVNSPCLNNRPTWDVRGPYSPEFNGKDVALVIVG